MAAIVQFDTQTNRILQYIQSAHTPDWTGRTDTLIDPNLSSVIQLPLKYWKHVAGVLEAMTTQEQSDIDAEIQTAITLDTRSGAKTSIDQFSDTSLLIRALADILKDEINILRRWEAAFKVEVAASSSLADLKTRVATLPATPDRTLSQLRTSIKNRIDSGSVDA